MASFWEDLNDGFWEDEQEEEIEEKFPEEDFLEEEYEDEGMDIALEEEEKEVPMKRANKSEIQPTERFSSNFTDDIVRKESGGNYKAINPNSSATGKYQFLWNTWGDKIKQVTGVSSKQEFLNNPEAQDVFYESYYVPNEMLPAVQRIKQKTGTEMSDDKLAKLYHFRGEKGAIDYLTGKLSDKPEAYNTSISSYIKQFGGQSYNPNVNPLAMGQGLLGENLQIQNLYNEEIPENSNFDFGFVQNLPDIYTDVSNYLKKKTSGLGQDISSGIDLANDYLSNIETMNNRNRMSKLLNKPRMVNPRIVNENPIYS